MRELAKRMSVLIEPFPQTDICSLVLLESRFLFAVLARNIEGFIIGIGSAVSLLSKMIFF